ncbi:MAG: YbhN family protein [Deinococcales bacterium]
MNKPLQVIGLSLLFSALAVVLLLLTGEKLDPRAFVGIVQIQPLGVVALVPTLMIWWVLMGWRVKTLASQLEGGKQITLWRGTQASLLSLFSAAVTPAASGSSFGLGWYLSRFIDPKQATAIAVYGLVLDMVFFAWSLPVSFLLLTWRGINLEIPVVGSLLGPISVLGAFVLGFLAWGLANKTSVLIQIVWFIFSLGFLRRFRRRVCKFLRRTEREIGSLRKMPLGVQLGLHLINGVSWFFHFAAFNVVAWALGIPNFDHVGIMAVQSLVVSSSFIVPTPGGSGYFDFALGKAFAVVGVSIEARTPLVLVWRFISYYLYVLIGPLIGGAALLRASNASHKTDPST